MTTTTTTGGSTERARDSVVLSVPASPRHAATARVVAASLAADLGFDVDEIDDLRLGINEAVAVLADDDTDAASFDRSGDRLEIEFRAVLEPVARLDVTVHRPGASARPALDELAERVLAAVVDQHEHLGDAVRLSKSSRGRR